MDRIGHIIMAGISISLGLYLVVDLITNVKNPPWLAYDLFFIGLNAANTIRSIIDAVEST